MNLKELMLTRRSIRKYTAEPVSGEMLEDIVKAAMLGANGKNLKPWSFIIVQDPETIAKLAFCRAGKAPMLATAKAAIVVVGDESVSDTCIEDCAAALTNMHLYAHSLGLGSCWLQCRLRPSDTEGISSEECVRQILGIPEGFLIQGLLAVGHPDQSPAPHDEAALPLDKIHREKW